MSILFTPGPVMVHREVLKEASRQVISHRGSDFRKLMGELQDLLGQVFQMSDGMVAVMPGSGTTAVDSMLWSLIPPRSRVLALVWGEFGWRIVESLEMRGAIVDVLDAKPGSLIRPRDIDDEIDGHEYITIVHNETSTGVSYNMVRELAEIANSRGAKVIVDTVSGLAGIQFKMDWGIYAAASCSHKAIAAPPGVGLVALSREALNRLKENPPQNTPPILNLSKYVKFLEDRMETPYTPPVNMLYTLKKALEIIVEMGLDNYIKIHERKAEVIYNNVGLKPLPERDEYKSRTVIALKARKPIEVKRMLEERGYVIATGMKKLKNRIIRIGTMGATTIEDARRLVEELNKLVEVIEDRVPLT